MIKELTSLRFIFMSMVFLHHMGYYPQGGVLGVAFFFVLSGFVITLGYKDRLLKRELTYSQFISRRFIRLYPLHWLCFIAAFLLIIKYDYLPSQSIPVALANVSLLQSWIPNESYYFSFNGVSWFLSDILFFILVYPLLLKVVLWFWDNNRFIFFVLALFIIPAILLVLTPKESRFYFFYICPLTRLIDFTLGACSALLFLKIKGETIWIEKHRTSLKVCLFCCIPLLIILSLLIPKEIITFSLFFVPFICLLIVLISLKPIGENTVFAWHPLILLGEFSFEFYLVHQLCFKFMEYHSFYGITSSKVVLILVFLISAALAVLCRKGYVKPVSKLLGTVVL